MQLLLFVLLSSQISRFGLATTFPGDYSALQALYTATNGENWNWLSSDMGAKWNFNGTSDPCVDNWQGVVCTSESDICATQTCYVLDLVLPEFGLYGTLPEELGDFAALAGIYFQDNSISGTLPTSITKLSLLEWLVLEFNSMHGSLPESISAMQSLSVINIGRNHFVGSIPESLCDLSHLRIFSCVFNDMDGVIPTNLGKLQKLQYISLMSNKFTGPVPDSFGDLTNLFMFSVGRNSLTGTIPDTMSRLLKLVYFYNDENFMRGPIPEFLGDMTNLTTLLMFKNYHTGTIPTSLTNLHQLEFFEVDINYLHGPVPPEMYRIDTLKEVFLHDNFLTGSIPTCISHLTNLTLFLIDNNMFTGPLPETMGNMTALVELSLHHNLFTGMIPYSFNHLSNLEALLVQNNQMDGFACFTSFSSGLNKLMHLDLSNNAFTGTLPKQLFHLESIRTLAAVKNCFHGSLPEDICDARNLTVLALDGLTAGTKCRQKTWDPFNIWNTYSVTYLKGSIPDCMWNMPNLTVLHVSGNGLTGTLPNQLPADSKLINISVSHNRMTGTIPEQFQTFPFVELCVSYNRFTGTCDRMNDLPMLTQEGYNNSILSLEANRLSGYLPNAFDHPIQSLAALTGNLFQCSSKHELPSQDEGWREYVCGSQQLDEALYAWSGAAAAVIIALAVGYYVCMKDDMQQRLSMMSEPKRPGCYESFRIQLVQLVNWSHATDIFDMTPNCSSDDSPNLKTFVHMLRLLRRSTIILASAVVVICVPLYITLKVVNDGHYSTHTYQYSWFASAAFLSGVVPAVLMLIVWLFLCVLLGREIMAFYKSLGSNRDSESSYQRNSDPYNDCSAMGMRFIVYSTVVLLNIVIVCLANGVYVYTLLSDQPQSVKLSAKVLIAIFKIIWNAIVVPGSVEYSSAMLSDSSSQRKWLIAVMLLFNNIGAPSLATAVSDDSCFHSAFVQTGNIDAYYSYPYCSLYDIVNYETGESACVEYGVVGLSTTYAPPFIYNYQCASAVMTNYIPVYILIYTYLTLAPPFAFAFVAYIASHSWFPEILLRPIPGILWIKDSSSGAANLLRADRIVASLMSHVAVQLTFGLGSPYLAVAIATAVISSTYMFQVLIGRHLMFHRERATKCETYDCTGGLERACEGILKGLRSCLWGILIGSSLFMAFFLLDIAGDEVGWRQAIWIPVVTVVFSLGSWLLFRLYSYYEESDKTFMDDFSEGLSISRDGDDSLKSLKMPLLA